MAAFSPLYMLAAVFMSLIVGLQLLLVGLKADDKIEGVWAAVFVPSWIGVGLALIGSVAWMFHTTWIDHLSVRSVSFTLAFTKFVSMLAFLVFFVLLTEKLDAKPLIIYPGSGGYVQKGGHGSPENRGGYGSTGKNGEYGSSGSSGGYGGWVKAMKEAAYGNTEDGGSNLQGYNGTDPIVHFAERSALFVVSPLIVLTGLWAVIAVFGFIFVVSGSAKRRADFNDLDQLSDTENY